MGTLTDSGISGEIALERRGRQSRGGILRNSPAVVEKHYLAWIPARHEALNEAVRATF